MRTFAYGTDASFYRLNPKMVVKVHSEEEVARILPIARKMQVPVTFRAAGTSLSGQAITDSVLLKLSHTGKNFRNYTIHVSRPLTLYSCVFAEPDACAPVSTVWSDELPVSADCLTAGAPEPQLTCTCTHGCRVTAARSRSSRA